MKNPLWRKHLVRMTFDKPIFNQTLLRYYKYLGSAADALQGKNRKEKNKKSD